MICSLTDLADTCYPKDFEIKYIRPIFTLLYYVLAHIYEAHFNSVLELTEDGHLNAVLCHFLAFSKEFSLLPGFDTSRLIELQAKLFPPKLGSMGSANLSIRRLSDDLVKEGNGKVAAASTASLDDLKVNKTAQS